MTTSRKFVLSLFIIIGLIISGLLIVKKIAEPSINPIKHLTHSFPLSKIYKFAKTNGEEAYFNKRVFEDIIAMGSQINIRTELVATAGICEVSLSITKVKDEKKKSTLLHKAGREQIDTFLPALSHISLTVEKESILVDEKKTEAYSALVDVTGPESIMASSSEVFTKHVIQLLEGAHQQLKKCYISKAKKASISDFDP